MKGHPFRVGYVDPPPYPSFVDTLRDAHGIEPVRIAADAAIDDAIAVLASCDGYCVKASRSELPMPLHVTASLLARLPRLRVAVSSGAGYDTIDVQACTAAGVAVVNQAGGNAQAVGEHALGMMLGLLKRMPDSHAALRAGTSFHRTHFLGRELSGRTVGLVGLGHTGSSVARLLRVFDGTVLACDPYLDADTCTARGATKVTLDELLARCDVVSVHCPLTAETRNLFDAARFAAMRHGAVFVNVARGNTYDEDALFHAITSGHIAGAGLDVWAVEPPAAAHPLITHPAVIASPHLAGVTHESRDRIARMAAQAFITAASGALPPRCVNPDIAARYRERCSSAR